MSLRDKKAAGLMACSIFCSWRKNTRQGPRGRKKRLKAEKDHSGNVQVHVRAGTRDRMPLPELIHVGDTEAPGVESRPVNNSGNSVYSHHD